MGFFANSAFAGNVEDCESLKESGQKSLYGLCVAWHNADEDAKDGLAQKFFDRAGYPVPGSEVDDPDPEPDFVCPCWSEVTFADICEFGMPLFTVFAPDSSFGDVLFRDNISFNLEAFGADTSFAACAHVVQDPQGNFLLDNQLTGLTNDEALICIAELQEMAGLYLDPLCSP